MSKEYLPCFQFPTTIVLVDDDDKFLNRMEVQWGRNLVLKSFKHSAKALEFLTKKPQHNSILQRCISEADEQGYSTKAVEVNLEAIKEEIYNKNRFEEVSTTILDYAMPVINGGELADQLKNTGIKIILLTGEAGAKVAINLFNEGVINCYIRKDDANFKSILEEAVRNLHRDYFCDLSNTILNSIPQQTWYKDPEFKTLFEKILKENNIVEFYLLDEFGSFIMLNDAGKPSWLAVANDELMQTYTTLAIDDEAPESIVETLKNKQMLPFFFSEEDFDARPAKWQKFLHPSHVLKGKETYYYSYITDAKNYHLDKAKIISYGNFLKARG